MKAFELTQTINEVFPVVEFESEGGGNYASPTVLNDIEVPNAARQVQNSAGTQYIHVRSIDMICLECRVYI